MTGAGFKKLLFLQNGKKSIKIIDNTAADA
jgi:hypothetical protein